MLGLILFVFVFYSVYTDLGHTAGTIVLVAGVIGFIAIGASAERDRWKANRTWVRTWKDGIPEQQSSSRQNVIVNIGTVNMGHTAVEEVPWEVPQRTVPERLPKELFICQKCGKMIRAESRRVLVGGQEMREYMCPRCRMRNRTAI